jgi:aminopeptidase-like protein
MTKKNIGVHIHELATELFPICRSLTGDGVRQTLKVIQRELPQLAIHEVKSGTKAFDWKVPQEWNITNGFIFDPEGKKIVDFKDNNLHVVGYSVPVDEDISLENLQQHLYSLPDQPDAIPFVASYYERRWGFCITHKQRMKLRPGKYHVKIESTLEDGFLTYGELILPGVCKEEVFLSTYICHPSMGNNELSGPTVTTYLAKWLMDLSKRHYTYRIIFIPETIGSIVYLSRNLVEMKKNIIAGFVVTCVGDNRTYSYLPSRAGNTLADRVAMHVLKHKAEKYISYSYLDRGSDERQYCSPGVDLPVASVMRTKYHAYPEYHTSKDDLTLITPDGLFGGYDALRKCLLCIERNEYIKVTVNCEPHMSPRGLYPTLMNQTESVTAMMDLLAYADGECDLLEIAQKINQPMWKLLETVDILKVNGLLQSKDSTLLALTSAT